MSDTSTLENKTGSWKYIRPIYRDQVAPCNATCPVGIDIEGFMNFLREREREEACKLVLRENPIPAITGRVCDHPCEKACHRRRLDQGLAVHAVERMMGDLILADLPDILLVTRPEKIGVVGSGPAGLACAYHLARLGFEVTILEAAAEAGGMLRLGIPEFRLPRRVLDRQIEWLKALGIEFRLNARIGDTVPWDDLGEFDAVFVATGAHRGRGMGIEGETGPGFRSGLEFLKEVNAGGRPDVGKQVVVVGGGNTAIDCARTALRLGADALVLYRRTRNEMPAIAQEVDEAEREGVRFTFLAAPVAVNRAEQVLESIECVRMELGPPDESGRRRPVPLEDDRFTLQADTVLTAIGEVAEFDYLPDDVEADGASVVVTLLGGTSSTVVFAGGDMVEQPRSVAYALGSGKRAAIGIDDYFWNRGEEEPEAADWDSFRFADGNLSMARWYGDDPIPRSAPNNRVVRPEDVNLNHFVPVPRHEDRELSGEASAAGFDEVNAGVAEQDAMDEANRCFNCGVCNGCELCMLFCPDVAITRGKNGERFHVDMSYCKGCGVCAEECPRGAIVMTREGL
jgi:NADPH-dependent glutamate synthase beta subunit-like oxidoreductase